MGLTARRALELLSLTYQYDGSDSGGQSWLEMLLDKLPGALPAGVFLALETDRRTAAMHSAIVHGSNATDAHAEMLAEGHRVAPDWVVHATYGSGQAWISLRQGVPESYFQDADWLAPLHGFGLQDMLAVVSTHPDQEVPACAFFCLAERPAVASSAERRLWQRLSLHLGTAQRLRRLVRDASPAVFDASGRCVEAHVDGDHRARLRELVKAWDRHHAVPKDGDVEPALDFWQRLSSGEWHLVDLFDSDGRRYIVAYPSRGAALAKLTAREQILARYIAAGRSNDWIAVEHGVTAGATSEAVKTIQRKLGVLSRVGLVTLLRSLGL